MASGSPPSQRRRLAYGIGAVAVVGFGTGLGIAAVTGGGGEDVDVAAHREATTTTERQASSTVLPIPSTLVVPTTTTTPATTAPPTTSSPSTTATTPPPSTTPVPPTSLPATTTPAPLPEPWPVPTSVPSSAPGTPAVLRVAYPGQGTGVLRLRLGEDSQMVVANAGGTEVRWQAVAAGGIAIGGQQVVEVVLVPGQSAALPLRTTQAGSASITVTSPTQRLVVPVEIA